MSRNNSMILKVIIRGNQRWTMLHNKVGVRSYDNDYITLIRETPHDEFTTEVDFIEEDFYNIKQCRDYINKWHAENDKIKE